MLAARLERFLDTREPSHEPGFLCSAKTPKASSLYLEGSRKCPSTLRNGEDDVPTMNISQPSCLTVFLSLSELG